MFKIIFVLLFAISLGVFSMSEKEFEKEYNKINDDLRGKIDICLKQNQDIVLKPLKHFDKAIRKEEYVEFVKDEKEVLFYLDNLDTSKFTASKEFRFLDLIMKNCSEKNLEIYEKRENNRKYCQQVFDELSFMRGLIYGIKNHGWSEKIKERAKRKIFDYIKYYAEAETVGLVSRLIPLSLLVEMLDYDLIDKKHKQMIVDANNRGDRNIDLVKKELKKNHADKFPKSCEGFKEHISKEFKFSKESAKDLKNILAEIDK